MGEPYLILGHVRAYDIRVRQRVHHMRCHVIRWQLIYDAMRWGCSARAHLLSVVGDVAGPI